MDGTELFAISAESPYVLPDAGTTGRRKNENRNGGSIVERAAGRTLSTWSKLALVAGLALAGMLILAVLALTAERSMLLEDRKVKTRHVVETAYGVLQRFHSLQEKGQLTEAQAKQEAIATVKSLRYETSEYFWINDLEPRVVMHPIKPELDGKDVSGYKDPDGNALFVEFVKVARASGSGYVDYLWPKPGAEKPVAKTSYVMLFKPWGWVIGSGIYIDDVNRIFRLEGAAAAQAASRKPARSTPAPLAKLAAGARATPDESEFQRF